MMPWLMVTSMTAGLSTAESVFLFWFRVTAPAMVCRIAPPPQKRPA